MNALRRVWQLLRWPLAVIVLLFLALIIWRLPAVTSEKKSAETVAAIHAQKLTLADADGKHLPPLPDPKEVDATVEGMDANQNGIRDDVELAIFKMYPNSPYTRAAELQYAMTEQMFLSSVFSTETWTAAIAEKGRAYGCLFSAAQNNLSLTNSRIKEVEELVFNTQQRKEANGITNKYRTSFKLPDTNDCDVDAANL